MNSVVFDRFAAELTDKGHSLTRTRKLIFSSLEDCSPISIVELEKQLENKLDRSTIYRTIDLFEKLGFVKKVFVGWKYKIELSEKYSPHHHHITCVNCRQIIPIESEEVVEQAIAQLARAHGVSPLSHQLEIQGLCQNCC